MLRAAFNKHPERFRGKLPRAKHCPHAVWINKPEMIEVPAMLRTKYHMANNEETDADREPG